MDKGHTTKTHIQKHMARWKRFLTIVTLTLICACALISLLYVAGALPEMLELSTLFAVFTAVFSILVPCCLCLTLITLSEPQESDQPLPPEKGEQGDELHVDLLHGTLVYGKKQVRCRQQILLVLQHMTDRSDHFISKSDFAAVLDDSSYSNNCDTANAKINTLVSSIRSTLRDLPYEIVNVNRQGYILNKRAETIEVTQ